LNGHGVSRHRYRRPYNGLPTHVLLTVIVIVKPFLPDIGDATHKASFVQLASRQQTFEGKHINP
jgi:hypothetical protein